MVQAGSELAELGGFGLGVLTEPEQPPGRGMREHPDLGCFRLHRQHGRHDQEIGVPGRASLDVPDRERDVMRSADARHDVTPLTTGRGYSRSEPYTCCGFPGTSAAAGLRLSVAG